MLSREEFSKIIIQTKGSKYISLYNKYRKEVDSKVGREFHNNYHLDNSINSKVNIGLFYNDELLSMLSLSKSRYNKSYEYEIIRYTVKERYVILGGFNKLLSYNYKPQSIITYKKLDLGTRNIYEKNGFTKLKRTNPTTFGLKKMKI